MSFKRSFEPIRNSLIAFWFHCNFTHYSWSILHYWFLTRREMHFRCYVLSIKISNTKTMAAILGPGRTTTEPSCWKKGKSMKYSTNSLLSMHLDTCCTLGSWLISSTAMTVRILMSQLKKAWIPLFEGEELNYLNWSSSTITSEEGEEKSRRNSAEKTKALKRIRTW